MHSDIASTLPWRAWPHRLCVGAAQGLELEGLFVDAFDVLGGLGVD